MKKRKYGNNRKYLGLNQGNDKTKYLGYRPHSHFSTISTPVVDYSYKSRLIEAF